MNTKVRKRTKLQREIQLVEIAEMQRRGRPLAEIAAHFKLSKSQISQDLKQIYRELFPATASAKLKLRAEIFDENRLIKKELWEAWERSKEDKEVQAKKKIASEAQGDGQNEPKEASERTEVSIRSGEKQVSRFLRKSKSLTLSQFPKVAAEDVEKVFARFDLLGRGRMKQLDLRRALWRLQLLGVIEIGRAAAAVGGDEGPHTLLFA